MTWPILNSWVAGLVLVCVPLPASPSKPPVEVEVRGKIVNPRGTPLGGAVVALQPANPDQVLVRSTSSDGSFRIAGPPQQYTLTVTCPGYAPYAMDLSLKPGGKSLPLEVKLSPGGIQVRGRVIPVRGRNLTGARLHFHKMRGYDFYAEVKSGQFTLSLEPGSYFADASAHGQFSIGDRFDLSREQSGLEIQLNPAPTEAGDGVREWIKANAIPLSTTSPGTGFRDLQPLVPMISHARVVGLGEATHGTKEFFDLKHRLLEFLVKDKGFTLFAMESLMPESWAIDDYLLTGKGDPAKALAGLLFWTWNTHEVLDMIRWMRKYNEDPAHAKKLRFFGLDMQGLKAPYSQAKDWLDRVAPPEAARLEDLHTRMVRLVQEQRPDPSEETLKRWCGFSKEAGALADRMEAMTSGSSQAASIEQRARQIQNLRIIAQYAALHGQPGRGLRDQFMARNLEWVLSQNKGEKAVVWAHNGHISFRQGAVYGANPMGWHLQQSLGDRYLAFGFAFREGGFRAVNDESGKYEVATFTVRPAETGTLDAALASPHIPILALNLHALPKHGSVRTWFDAPQGTWDIPADFGYSLLSRCFQKAPITRYYDGLFFVERTSPSTPNPPQVK